MKYSIRIRLKELLDEKEMKQKELAEKASIRESTISDMNFEHISKIAEVLKIKDIRDIIELKIDE